MNLPLCPIAAVKNTYTEYLNDDSVLRAPEKLFKEVHKKHEEKWGTVCGQMQGAVNSLRRHGHRAAEARLRGASKLIREATDSARTLLNVLTKSEFQDIRQQFMPEGKYAGASGLLSPTFNEMDQLMEVLMFLFRGIVIKKHISLLDLYETRKPREFFLLSERIFSIDQAIYEWKQFHLMLVLKHVAEDEKGTGGMTPKTLRRRAAKRYYSDIVKLRKSYRDLQLMD